jgi:putative membrane protein
MSLFSSAEEKRVSDAIAKAERATSGEILVVVTSRSESYLYVPFLVAALVALLVPWPFIYLTWLSMQWVYVVQLVVFLLVLALLIGGQRRLWFVPKKIKHMHAHRRAVEQFRVQNMHTTDGRTGVLIFVSLAERFVEIVADKGIDKAVPAGTWQAIVDQLRGDLARDQATEGFVTAVAATGQHLAKHFPPGKGDPNELPNHLIVLH